MIIERVFISETCVRMANKFGHLEIGDRERKRGSTWDLIKHLCLDQRPMGKLMPTAIQDKLGFQVEPKSWNHCHLKMVF